MMIHPHHLLKRIKKNERLVRQISTALHETSAIVPEQIKDDVAHLCQVVNAYNKLFKEIYHEYDVDGQIEEHGEFRGPPELH